jgi:hypothetical protein
MKKIKEHKADFIIGELNTSGMADDFFEDVTLFGIQCALPAYQFILIVNEQLAYNFISAETGEICLQKIHKNESPKTFKFSLYNCFEEYLSTEHIIYVNQSEGEYLLPELKGVDYIWLMKGEKYNAAGMQELHQCIRQIQQVQIVSLLSIDRIKNKENLIF